MIGEWIRLFLAWFWSELDLACFPVSTPFRGGGLRFCCSLVAFMVCLFDRNSKPTLVFFSFLVLQNSIEDDVRSAKKASKKRWYG